MRRRVEIAGGGIGGLAAAAALAQQGLDVHVHERRPEVREEGGAIVLFENMLRALDRLGATEDAVRNGDPKRSFAYTDHKGRSHVASTANPAGGRYYYVSRHDVHRALLNAAVAAGATVHPGSTAAAARPDGTLVMSDGRQRRADLLVAADGVGSALRGSLGVGVKVKWLGHWGVRVALDYPVPEAPPGHFYERWSGPLRLGYGRLGNGVSAAFVSSPAQGLTPDRKALDVPKWIEAFPEQEELIRNIAGQDPKVAPFSEVVCSAWSRGRVALLGDAAHAMPPHRGQGAAMAVLDAVHLGHVLGRHQDPLAAEAVGSSLAEWESEVRPVVRRTQRNAVLYCRAQQSWPRPLLPLRPAFFRAIGRTRRLDLSLLQPPDGARQARGPAST